jgi:hypothetical protein
VDLDGGIISFIPSSEPLQEYLIGLLHIPFLDTFSSMGMASFPILLDLMKVV